ncbi:hypothetical protein SLE2022_335160 [Rubroshorea leprosula]
MGGDNDGSRISPTETAWLAPPLNAEVVVVIILPRYYCPDVDLGVIPLKPRRFVSVKTQECFLRWLSRNPRAIGT